MSRHFVRGMRGLWGGPKGGGTLQMLDTPGAACSPFLEALGAVAGSLAGIT